MNSAAEALDRRIERRHRVSVGSQVQTLVAHTVLFLDVSDCARNEAGT